MGTDIGIKEKGPKGIGFCWDRSPQ